MADWRERLSSEFGLWKFDGMGSWRGIPFVVKAADGEIGRRNVIREYPGSDEANLARQRLQSQNLDAG